MPFLRFILAVLAGSSVALAHAEAVVPAPISPSLTSSVIQMVFALGCVLGLIVLAAWLLRRFSFPLRASSGQLRVVSGVMVGQRERVVIVEMQGQWLVLGVTPQSVNLLSSVPKPEQAPEVVTDTPPFAQWLSRAMQKRSGSVQGADQP